MLRFVLLFVLFSVAVAVPETHHFVLNANGFDIHQDIIADVRENYAILVIGATEGCTYCNSTVNLHDFDTGMLAFKEVATQTCYLTKSPIPALNINLYTSKHSKAHFNYTAHVHGPSMTYDEVFMLAGLKIAEFCNEYDVRHMELTHVRKHVRQTGETPLNRNRRCAFACGVCFVNLDGEFGLDQPEPQVLGR